MSEKMSHVYVCDVCGKEDEVGFKLGLPDNWTLCELRTKTGVSLYKDALLCGYCGYMERRDTTVSNPESTISKLLRKCGLFKNINNNQLTDTKQ